MATRHDNLVVLPDRGGTERRPSVQLEVLEAAIEQLDELDCLLQQLSPHVNWSAQRWMIASTPFRMRLTSARKRLSDLAGMSLDSGQTAMCWALELGDLRLDAERWLQDIEVCLYRLQCIDTLARERARETEAFASSRSELLKVIAKIRYLIAQRFPTAVARDEG